MNTFGALFLRIFVCAVLLSVIGCDRHSSLTGGAPTVPTDPNTPPGGPDDPSSIEVSGYVVNGPLDGASVTVYDSTGAQVGEAITNAEGFYSVQVESPPPYTIEVTGGSLEGLPYLGLLQAACPSAEHCNATPITTAVARLMNDGGFNEDEAEGLLNARVGVDFDPFIRHYVEDEPVVGFDLDSARLFIDDGEQLEVWVVGMVEWAVSPIEEQQAPAGVLYHYNVTASAGEGGSIGPVTEGSFQHGSVANFSVTPDVGYHLLAVDGCSGSLVGDVYTTGPITSECQVFASFAINTYTVTTSADTGGSVTPATQSAAHGQAVAFTVEPVPGYSIAAIEGCDGTLAGNTFTTDPLMESCAINASFSLNSYTVSTSVSAGGAITPALQTVAHGSAASFTIMPSAGYSIMAVTGCDGELSGNSFTTADVAGACTVSATFLLNSYTITASAGTGGNINPASQDAEHGSTATFTVTPDTGYSINEVSGCGGILDGGNFITAAVHEACSVIASFSLDSYTVTAEAGTGGSVSPETQNIDHGSTATLTVTPDTGYSIDSVSGCGGTLDGSTFTTGAITELCSIAASFSLNSYTVSASAGTGGGISPASDTVEHGSTATFTLTPDSGYSIDEVSGCGGILDGSTFTTDAISAACSVTASFSLNSYSVSASAGTGGSISPASDTVVHGSAATFTVTPDTGYSIDEVSGCSGSLDGNTFMTGAISGACSVTASFSLNSYSVSATAGTGGSITPASNTADHGSTASFTITPDTGYSIDEVSGCGGTLDGSIFTTGAISGACSVTASFSLNSYSVSASAGTGGSITPASDTADHGSTATFTVTPDTGYSIDEVSGCGGTLDGNTFTTGAVSGACSVTASFSLNSYSVSATAGTGGSISPASDAVAHGSTASFTITPDAGYSIDEVTGCSGTLDANTFTTGVISEACSVTASFSLNSYSVSASAGAGGSISPASDTVNHGSTASFTVTPDTGYSIDEVSGCSGNLDGSTFTTGAVSGACSVTASFSLNSYSVSATAGTGGSISPASDTVAHGSTASFTITPDAGYSIDEVTGCSGTLDANTFTTGVISEACSVTASFSLNSYSVSASAGAGGSISPASDTVEYGSTATFTLTPDVGYSVDEVSGCSGTLDGSAFTTGAISAACSVTASFSLNSYSVSATAGTGGSISPASDTVEHGSTATFTVTPDANYSVDEVSGCGGTLDGSTYTTAGVTEVCSVTASFSLNSYSVSTSAGTGGSISPASNTVEHGSAASFTITPADGFAVDTVSGCGGDLDGSVYTTGSITAGCTVTASFEVNLAAPQNVGASAGNEQVTVTWDAVEDAYDYDIVFATETFDPTNPSVAEGYDVETSVEGSPHTVLGLTSGTQYYFAVNANTEAGNMDGPSSTLVSATPTASCYDIDASSPLVCSGNGTCSGNDTCSCSSGFEGNQCQTVSVPSCFGVSADDENVCSGKGVCSSTDSCECNALVTGEQCNVDLKFSTGSSEYYFPTNTGKYSIVDGPDLPTGETYVWKFEVLATGYWPGQTGFTFGVAGYPLVNTDFHELGAAEDEWAFRGRDGNTRAEEGVVSAFGGVFQNVGDQIMIELNTVTGVMNIFTKRVGASEFTLEGGRSAFLDVIPTEGGVLRPAISGICWQPCGIKFIE